MYSKIIVQEIVAIENIMFCKKRSSTVCTVLGNENEALPQMAEVKHVK